ncbi:SDR family NAD(P)-dependent oxidoreductase [Kineosporia sp. NBRC 101731]|uniref:type I polyketide synthase n=1 Tax=Kineosporia sp. NBRC 101731 TaxID=3032199 RepID=UPI0024A07FD7|nr:SDR family NAD(P)-dependent oxidoreductase [Kineosporia sp. NBRC 101731]GLY30841.1 hypothetical protein Kisp02_42060 [Kineosporia sp. NBRC 101731]
MTPAGSGSGLDIAIVGMACRFPGARSPEQFWENLVGGVSSIRSFDQEELIRAGADPELVRNPRYVPVTGYLEGADEFDHGLFGITPSEARVMDPQHRLFLECAAEALERSGRDLRRADDVRIGCFGGAGMALYAGSALNSYFGNHLVREPDLLAELAPLQAYVATQTDHLCSRVSHRLGLRGPSIGIQTACSTGLVAVHLAWMSLLAGECDLALAGAAGIHFPVAGGYLYEEGGILAPDGVCRPFDASASGTVGGSGVGMVALRRLDDALADDDPVLAVVRGSAVNNDGALRAGYLAPSSEGQVDVVRSALRMAGAEPAHVGYIEAHGTGTVLGDQIELTALEEVFVGGTPRGCLLGSVKSSIGHLDVAAGTAGLIKTVLALQHGAVPPTANFRTPNRRIAAGDSPFRVVTEAVAWPAGRPLAGVSSFGGGGTNAHVVLAPAPQRDRRPGTPGPVLLGITGRTAQGLRTQASDYAEHLLAHPEQLLEDVVATANTGRVVSSHRAVITADDRPTLVDRLRAVAGGDDTGAVAAGSVDPRRAGTREQPVFLYSGQGGPLNQATETLRAHPVFREALEECAQELGEDGPVLMDLIRAADPVLATRARWAQPALFAFQYALTRTWSAAGVEPVAVLGHSLGEYAAACTAGVFTLGTAARLVQARGRLMDQLCPTGAMVAILAGEDQVRAAVDRAGSLAEVAVVNTDQVVVLGGPQADLDAAVAALDADITTVPVPTTHAFHTAAVEPMMADFAAVVAQATFRPPTLGVVPCLGGDPHGLATPDYWVRQLRSPVRFASALREMADQEGERVFLEIGPSATLSRHGLSLAGATTFVPSVRVRPGAVDSLADAAGRLFVHGVRVDLDRLTAPGRRPARVPVPLSHRIPQRHWVGPHLPPAPGAVSRSSGPGDRRDPAANTPERLFVASLEWEDHPLPDALAGPSPGRHWTVLATPGDPIAEQLSSALAHHGHPCDRQDAGKPVTRPSAPVHQLSPDSPAPAWGVVQVLPSDDHATPVLEQLAPAVARLRDWTGGQPPAPDRVVFLTTRATGQSEEAPDPAQAAVWALARVARLENPAITVHCLELVRTAPDTVVPDITGGDEPEVCYRDGVRRRPGLREETLRVEPPALAADGTYLVTGGLGALGIQVLRWLGSRGATTVVAAGRTADHQDDLPVLAELAAAGVRVVTAAVDVADAIQIRQLLDYLDRSGPPLRGVVHAAGVLSDATLPHLEESTLAAVFAPKLDGSRNLDRACSERSLDFFISFSSSSAWFGAPGQAAYSAANAAMETVSAHRRVNGQRAVSIAWGPWGEGMYAAGRERRTVVPAVVGEIDAQQAFTVLDHAVTHGSDLLAMVLDPAARSTDRRPSALAAQLWSPGDRRGPAAAAARRIREAQPWQREQRLGEYLMAAVSGVTGASSEEFDSTVPFQEQGIDSLTGLRLRDRLNWDLGLRLPASCLYRHPTAVDLSAHLMDLVCGVRT